MEPIREYERDHLHGSDAFLRRDVDKSLPSLIAELADETTTLLRQELALARAELTDKVSSMQTGATTLGIGSVLGVAALVILMFAAAFLLDQRIQELWISAGIVGAAGLIIAGIMMLTGRRKLMSPTLGFERTGASLRKDADLARAHAAYGSDTRLPNEAEPARAGAEKRKFSSTAAGRDYTATTGREQAHSISKERH